MGFTIVASAVDPGRFASTALNGVDNMNVPIWRVGANLYQMCIAILVPGDVNSYVVSAYKSTDEGATWAPQDSANQPANSAAANNFLAGDGTTLFVLVGPQIDQDNVALRLYSFDCTSDTWTLIDSAGPAAHWPAFIGRLSTGDFVIAYGHNLVNDLWLASFDGATWTNIQNLTLVTSLLIRAQEVYGDVDQDDWTHIAFRNTGASAFWHVSVDDTLALGTVDSLTGIDHMSHLKTFGDYVLIGVSESNLTKVLSGTPLAAPSFTVSDTIDSVIEPDFPMFAVDAGKLYLCYGDWNTEETLWYSSTTDPTGISGWAPPVKLYDVNSDPLPPDPDSGQFVYPPEIFAAAGQFWLASTYPNSVTNTSISFYVGAFSSSVLRNTFE